MCAPSIITGLLLLGSRKRLNFPRKMSSSASIKTLLEAVSSQLRTLPRRMLANIAAKLLAERRRRIALQKLRLSSKVDPAITA